MGEEFFTLSIRLVGYKLYVNELLNHELYPRVFIITKTLESNQVFASYRFGKFPPIKITWVSLKMASAYDESESI